jgi:hypothetical protein
MSGELERFLGGLAGLWWLWAVAAVILADQFLRATSLGYRGATDRAFRPGLRATLMLAVVVVAALAGGFVVYRDAQARLADTEKRLAEAVVLRPELKTLETTTERQPDGSYKISKLVEIVSRYPPSALHIAATAKGITELKVEPQSKRGMMIHGPSSQNGDTIRDRIQGPVGKYLLIIHAASAEVTLTHRFE